MVLEPITMLQQLQRLWQIDILPELNNLNYILNVHITKYKTVDKNTNLTEDFPIVLPIY